MSVQSIFSSPVFGLPTGGRKDQAAAGFSQVFAAILAKQLRSSTTGDVEGPLGTAGGTAGDIYGAFFDQVMGNVLANSPLMKPLNRAIERELSRPLHSSVTSGSKGGVAAPKPDRASISIPIQNRTNLDLSSDSRGPLLLPPEPTAVASVLPPPPGLEG
jgi:hypothetical protein